MYDILLQFQDPQFQTEEVFHNYLCFKRSDMNMAMALTCIIISAIEIGSRLLFPKDPIHYIKNPTASYSLSERFGKPLIPL